MNSLFRSLFPSSAATARYSVPDGTRFYAIGDIHGRLDLFEQAIEAVEAHDAGAGVAETTVILLGDLIDRGPDSAGVIARTREWQQQRRVRILAGNHEEMFLESFRDRAVMRQFLRHGGLETLRSYGVSDRELDEGTVRDLQDIMRQRVPEADRSFVEGFEDWIVAGDYLFVHAGIVPGVPIEEQSPNDLRWIRNRFLTHRGRHPQLVIHGHTVQEAVDEQPNRIGIDTGAYRSGVLTTLVLEGTEREVLQTVAGAQDIAIRHAAIG